MYRLKKTIFSIEFYEFYFSHDWNLSSSVTGGPPVLYSLLAAVARYPDASMPASILLLLFYYEHIIANNGDYNLPRNSAILTASIPSRRSHNRETTGWTC